MKKFGVYFSCVLSFVALFVAFTALVYSGGIKTPSVENLTDIPQGVNEAAVQPNTDKKTPSDTSNEQSNGETSTPSGNTDIDAILNSMTLEEKVCQLMFVTPESITGVGQVIAAGNSTKNALAKYPVGGIIYFSQNLQTPEQTKEMIKNSQNYSKIPLFIGVDEEGGRVARLGSNSQMGVTKHPAMADVKSNEEAYSIGQTLGVELKALGFNVDFAPVADVIVNKKNSEIGDRSFGEDALVVSERVSNLVTGMEEQHVSSVLKHFPGHGSTVANSHNGYSASPRTIEELRACEFLPFKAGIDAGSDFIMVSHMTLTNATEEKLPASLSSEVITGFLKGELGFEGIVITDALNMGAITKEFGNGEAAVKAIEAGADMLLMPADVGVAKEAVMNAVATGRISEERINESVRKILTAKAAKGLI